MANPFAAAADAVRPSMRSEHYAGAGGGALTADWALGGQSTDAAIRQGIIALRRRGRDLADNNAHARNFVGLCEQNIAGKDGITLQGRVGEQAGTLNRAVNTELERSWRDWCQADTASADGRLCMAEIEQQVAREVPRSGEVIVRMLPGFKNAHAFSTQVLDADQLDVNYDEDVRSSDGSRVRMGVRVDKWNRPMEYRIWSDHPYDYQGSSRGQKAIWVPADEICHPYLQAGVGASRGLTWFTPVLLDSRMLAGYRTAEVVAARTAAAKMGFFVPDAEHLPPDPDAAKQLPMMSEPGKIPVLSHGYKFESWDPQHPTSAFPAFDKAMLRTIAAGLRTSYNVLASDLEGVSYSSMRSGELQARDVWQILQNWLIRNVTVRIYRQWLKWSITTGATRVPTRNPADYHEAKFTGRTWSWVDPLKDVATHSMELDLVINSRTRICQARGIDFEDLLIDMKRERELMAEYGVELRLEGGKTVIVFNDTQSDEGARDARALRLAGD